MDFTIGGLRTAIGGSKSSPTNGNVMCITSRAWSGLRPARAVVYASRPGASLVTLEGVGRWSAERHTQADTAPNVAWNVRGNVSPPETRSVTNASAHW